MMENEEIKMDPSWQKLYDDLKDPNVSKEAKDRIWTFIHTESRRFMEFAYPSIIKSLKISDYEKNEEDRGAKHVKL